MTALEKHLSSYAAYHRDGRNVATHMAGIPLIVLAVAVLTSRPILAASNADLTPAMLLSAVLSVFYLRLDLRLGFVMTVLLALASWAGLAAARLATPAWLAIGLGGFVAGWFLQLVGHHYEGRKPAFLDDISGLIIGPLFIVAEIVFLLKLRPKLARTVHAAQAEWS